MTHLQHTGSPDPELMQLRDRLLGSLIGLARAAEGNDYALTDSTAAITVDGLLATLPGANPDRATMLALLERADDEKRKLVPECYQCAASCGRTENFDMDELQNVPEDIRSLKHLILLQSQGIAALGCRKNAVHHFLYKALFSIGMRDWGIDELLPIALEAAEIQLKYLTPAE